MARGSKPGERRGGRTKGTPNKAKAEREQAIAIAGITPKQFLLNGLAFYQGLVEKESARGDEADEGKIREAYAAGKEFAKDVAPYCHSRYGTLEPYRGTQGLPATSEAERSTARSEVGEIVNRFQTASVAQPNGNGALKH